MNDNLFVYSLIMSKNPSLQIGKLPFKTQNILLTLTQWSLWLFKYILTQLAIWLLPSHMDIMIFKVI